MSSSSDEDLSKFTEAADTKLFNNSLFTQGKAEHSLSAPVKPSQRYLDAPNENRTDLKVTPGFQKHVASRLMKILDSSLDQDSVSTATPEHDSNGNCTSEVPSNQPEGGIRLFGASAAFLASCNITPPPPTKRRKRGRKFACISSESEDDSSSNEADSSNPSFKDSPGKTESLGVRAETELSERFAACAVSSDWILNGDAVKGWAPPFKGKEPLQGEATPDLLKLTMLYKRENANKRLKQEFSSKEDHKQTKKRGKRGGAKNSKTKVVMENDNSENTEDPSGIVKSLTAVSLSEEHITAESLTELPKKKKKKKKRKKEPTSENMQEDNDPGNIDKLIVKKYRKLEALCRKFASQYGKAKGTEGTSGDVAGEKTRRARKKKRREAAREAKRKPLWISESGIEEDKLNLALKELQKKERRRRRRELELDLLAAAAAAAEDEGFDSDPTKAEKIKKEKRRWLKEQEKCDKKKWQNSMEYLSMDLAKLVMSNVKQD